MNIFEILQGKDSDNPILKEYRVAEKQDNGTSHEKRTEVIDVAKHVPVPEKIEDTFNFVGKSLCKVLPPWRDQCQGIIAFISQEYGRGRNFLHIRI